MSDDNHDNHDKHVVPPALFIEPGADPPYVALAKALGGAVIPLGRHAGTSELALSDPHFRARAVRRGNDPGADR